MSPALKLVVRFCLEQAEKIPVRKRISLYRGLAQICYIPAVSAQLCHIADALERAERTSRAFTRGLRGDEPAKDRE